MRTLTAQWGSDLVTGWHEWIDLPERVGDLLADGVLGAKPGEVIACDSTTVNLYKLASAVLETRPGAILTDRANFPTDRYVLEGLARSHRRELRIFEADPLNGPQAEDVASAAGGDAVALVCLSHVAYRSGALADVERITRESPAPVIWDLSHSAGAVAIELGEWGVELAVGCSYKYLNAGPGAPAYLYIAAGRQAELRTPIQGWFGQRDQFEMERAYDPEPGVRGFLAGTPPILGLAAVEEGAKLIAEAGVSELEAKVETTDRIGRRAARRLARSTRLRARDAARPGQAGRPHQPPPRRGLAHHASPDRARPRDPGLPRAGLDSPRPTAALHALRRRIRRARAAAHARRGRRLHGARACTASRDLTIVELPVPATANSTIESEPSEPAGAGGYKATIASISTSAPLGRPAAATATRAGGSPSAKNSPYTSFTRAKSPMSVR